MAVAECKRGEQMRGGGRGKGWEQRAQTILRTLDVTWSEPENHCTVLREGA